MKVTLRCPHCGGALDVEVKGPDNTESMIWEAFLHYLAWGERSTLYKSYFKKVGDYRWHYRVQLYDSPMGDTWVSGEFEWRPPAAPVFVSKETSSY